MTDLQAAELIEKVFKTHWHTWRFEVEETAVWVKHLRKYDYARAKTAINNFYMAQTRQGKPAPGSLLASLREHATIKTEAGDNEPVCIFEITKAGKKRGYKFFANPNKMPAKEQIEKMAETMRTNFNNMYGDGHIVVREMEIPF